jgi:hypothetical protein
LFGVCAGVSGHLVAVDRFGAFRHFGLCNSNAHFYTQQPKRLMNAPPVLQPDKALPSPTKGKLPAAPPPADLSFSSSPPQLPPKVLPDSDKSSLSNGFRPPPIDVALSNQSNELLGQGPPSTFLLSVAFLMTLSFVWFRPRHSFWPTRQPSQPRFTRQACKSISRPN